MAHRPRRARRQEIDDGGLSDLTRRRFHFTPGFRWITRASYEVQINSLYVIARKFDRVKISKMTAWEKLQRNIIQCKRCPRLREYCQQVATEKRAAFRNETYWGRPLPNLGDPKGRLLIVGLAPAAHGGNRTGRMFTGDRSGDFLFHALYDTGFASQPTSTHLGDGLELIDAAMTAVAHCAPPGNKPLPIEIDNCSEYLQRTFDLMPNLRGVVALGKIGFDGCLRLYRSRGWLPAGPRPSFGHGVLHRFMKAPFLLGCFHPSQQNTFTGKLTPKMIRNVFSLARELINTRS